MSRFFLFSWQVVVSLPLLGVSVLAVEEFPASKGGRAKGKIEFIKHQLDSKFRSEGVAVGDFNHDTKRDIAAGSVWFAAPDWKMHTILEKPKEFKPKGYSQCFNHFAEDVSGDGWDDMILVSFPGKPTYWFENPRKPGVAWKRHILTQVTNNESPTFIDLDRDGKREFLLAFSGGRMGYAQAVEKTDDAWKLTAVSKAKAPGTHRFAHGLGAGDINGDGRRDVLVPKGWWEAPADKNQTPWKFHPAKLGSDCSNMYVYDFDGDGDNDVLSSSAHQFGIWWHEQTPKGWKTHVIDKSYSQTHSLCFADINGDSLPDFVTGKRWWAHNGHDPGGNQPAVMFWYELSRIDGKPVWTPHPFDQDSGIGTQFEVTDLDGDGLLDVITSNKKGVFFFRQVRK